MARRAVAKLWIWPRYYRDGRPSVKSASERAAFWSVEQYGRNRSVCAKGHFGEGRGEERREQRTTGDYNVMSISAQTHAQMETTSQRVGGRRSRWRMGWNIQGNGSPVPWERSSTVSRDKGAWLCNTRVSSI